MAQSSRHTRISGHPFKTYFQAVSAVDDLFAGSSQAVASTEKKNSEPSRQRRPLEARTWHRWQCSPHIECLADGVMVVTVGVMAVLQ